MATYVIAGGGLAGAKAAQTLRDDGFDGDIVLLGAEPEPPYERPPLSKGLLLGTAERASVFVQEPGCGTPTMTWTCAPGCGWPPSTAAPGRSSWPTDTA
jgi:NADPH-dependent 2,4-dienoyl-CoA reductase/sulfur reductase-like enzyme